LLFQENKDTCLSSQLESLQTQMVDNLIKAIDSFSTKEIIGMAQSLASSCRTVIKLHNQNRNFLKQGLIFKK
jgi:hypothetical protein